MTGVAALMVQGTASDAGKSMLVAGLCRALPAAASRSPLQAAEHENNAAVDAPTAMRSAGRRRCRRGPRVAPERRHEPRAAEAREGDAAPSSCCRGAAGAACGRATITRSKTELMPAVLKSFAGLAEGRISCSCEGAGSPAEVNLREGDIANMGFARAAGVPVVLVGDIERGGVIAQLVGTRCCWRPRSGRFSRLYREQVPRRSSAVRHGARHHRGTHGPAPLWVSCRGSTAWHLPEEDALGLAGLSRGSGRGVRIVVPRLPAIANFDDLDPLSQEPEVDLRIVERRDGAARRRRSRAPAGQQGDAARSGLPARCGMGHRHPGASSPRRPCAGPLRRLPDAGAGDRGSGRPRGRAGRGCRAGPARCADDAARRQASPPRPRPRGPLGLPVEGYEIHLGRTDGPDTARPLLEIEGRPEGARSTDGRVVGCYLHGIFASDEFRSAFLERLRTGVASALAYEARIEATLDELAAHLERHLAMDRLLAIARARSQPMAASARRTRAVSGQ